MAAVQVETAEPRTLYVQLVDTAGVVFGSSQSAVPAGTSSMVVPVAIAKPLYEVQGKVGAACLRSLSEVVTV